ncbi:peptidase [Nordella sp. HKS 07]|uniref:peptidase n=1 Tax=Nordella sp. HKS 07 TaxID=2712222 RepID=UPI0013E17090|nr:peptidase [Nordella sp. HKS 07]QIG50184.1 peptidase [Nordella sp. HKS 07]
MTYCVGLLMKDGFVLAADTRTNAGLDNIATFRKLHSWAQPGKRVFALATSGNLATTQAVVSLLTEGTLSLRKRGAVDNLFNAKTMFQAAQIVGRAARDVQRSDEGQLFQSEDTFSASFLFAGQIGAEPPRLFQIYSAGNFIEAAADTPFLQIGEHKYGKPILDRVSDQTMRLGEAAKLVLLSFDSTIRSNLSVGLPIDLLVYEKDALKLDRIRRIERDDPYFRKLSDEWGKALRHAFSAIEEFDI